MLDCLGLFFVIVGTAFIMISAVGVLRMPDVYLRLSASTKTSTLGVLGVLLGAICFLAGEEQLGVISRTIAIIVFIVLTSPVGAHLLGRAAYYRGIPLWDRTKTDELRGKFDVETGNVSGQLESNSQPPEQS